MNDPLELDDAAVTSANPAPVTSEPPGAQAGSRGGGRALARWSAIVAGIAILALAAVVTIKDWSGLDQTGPLRLGSEDGLVRATICGPLDSSSLTLGIADTGTVEGERGIVVVGIRPLEATRDLPWRPVHLAGPPGMLGMMMWRDRSTDRPGDRADQNRLKEGLPFAAQPGQTVIVGLVADLHGDVSPVNVERLEVTYLVQGEAKLRKVRTGTRYQLVKSENQC